MSKTIPNILKAALPKRESQLIFPIEIYLIYSSANGKKLDFHISFSLLKKKLKGQGIWKKREKKPPQRHQYPDKNKNDHRDHNPPENIFSIPFLHNLVFPLSDRIGLFYRN